MSEPYNAMDRLFLELPLSITEKLDDSQAFVLRGAIEEAIAAAFAAGFTEAKEQAAKVANDLAKAHFASNDAYERDYSGYAVRSVAHFIDELAPADTTVAPTCRHRCGYQGWNGHMNEDGFECGPCWTKRLDAQGKTE